MGKRLILFCLLAVFLSAGTSLADLIPIKAGDHVYVNYDPIAPYPLQVVAKDGSYSFYTFCIEDEIYLGGSGTEYVVGSISSQVISGGSNNDNPPPGYLSYAAASIYNDYLTNGIKSGFTKMNYQQAIWYAENETDSISAKALELYNMFDDSTSWNGVLALNLNFLSGRESQSLLVKPVPEPVSMLLFGTGLLGVGGYVRRKLKK
jgi:hypothetical protein